MINIKEIEEKLTPYTNRRVVNLIQSDKMIYYIYQLLVYYDFYSSPFEIFKKYVFQKSIVRVLKEFFLWKSEGYLDRKNVYCDQRLAFLIISCFYEVETNDLTFKHFIENIKVTKNQKQFEDSLTKINANVYKVTDAINTAFSNNQPRIFFDLKTLNKITEFENEIVKYIESGEVKTESEIIFLTRIILK